MSVADVRKIIRVAGRICINPTDISDSEVFPFSGTALGITRDAELRFNVQTRLVKAEEFGSQVVEAVTAGESALFAFVLREFDNDALAAIFPNTATGTTTGNVTIEGRVSGVGVNRSGYLLSNKAVKLLFAPRVENTVPTAGSTTNLPLDEQPMVLIRKAIPMIEETAMLQLSLKQELGIGVLFQAIPDSSGRLYDVGRRGDLTL